MVISLVLDTFTSRQSLLHRMENECSSVCCSLEEFVVSMIAVSLEDLMVGHSGGIALAVVGVQSGGNGALK